MTVAHGEDQLVFLPLGGAGEIGMNLNLYGYGPPEHWRWLAIDLGVTFGSGDLPGVNLILPDPSYLEDHLDRLDGLLLTHAHEDHLGAVPYLWPRLRCPVYATKFAIAVLTRKLAEVGLADVVPIIEVPLGGRFRIGPFDLELVTLTHSIPEPNAVAIRTDAGLVLHTGDWKLDPDPVVGERADEAALTRLGDEGVLAMVCDSTNALDDGRSGSEGALLPALMEVVKGCSRRVAVTCFASNIARLRTLAAVAAATGRSMVLAGTSLKRNFVSARECGYLLDVADVIDEALAATMPPHQVLYACTGSQGEGNAALARMAFGNHPRLSLEAGDTVIFSARTIPGNEIGISRLQNALLRREIEIIGSRDAFVHVSGHPAQDELRDMYRMVRPRIAIPVHGELRHMRAHERIARAGGVEEVIVVENGSVVRIAPEPAGVDHTVTYGRLALEGNRLVPLDGNLVRGRTQAIYKGVVVATIAVNERGDLARAPQLSSVGLLETEGDEVLERAGAAIRRALAGMSSKALSDDDVLGEAIRMAVRRTFRELFDKKPLTYVHVVRC